VVSDDDGPVASAARPGPAGEPAPTGPGGERALVAARGSGCEDFVGYYKAEATLLMGFVMRLGASPHDAADVMQSVMVQLLQQWDEVTHPRAWTRAVATRMFVKSMASSREVMTAVVPEEMPVASPLLSPVVYVEVIEAAREIQRLLAPLPRLQRMALVWRMEGLADREIARELHTTPAAIRTAVRCARQRLREILSARTRGEER